MPPKRFTTSPVIEDYLQTIYSLAAEGMPVKGVRLAENLGVSAPSVTVVLQRMTSEGYVRMNEHKEVFLTPKGQSAAEVMVRRHRLAERMLTDLLGIDWADAHLEAHRMEHAISPLLEARLMELLHSPATCPHGSPIPGSYPGEYKPGVPLDRLHAGDEARVQRVTEKAEADRELLTYLAQNHMKPGASIRVLEITPWESKMTVLSGDRKVALDLAAASQILVERTVAGD